LLPVVAAFALLVLSVTGFVLAIWGRGVERMRIHLRRVSPGRIFTAFLYPEEDLAATFMLKSKEWSTRIGAKVVDISGDVEKPAVAVTAVTDMPPKAGLNVIESEHHGHERKHVAGNKDGNSHVQPHRMSHLFRVPVADHERRLEVKESKCKKNKNRMAVVQ
jgi:hypothetical protein